MSKRLAVVSAVFMSMLLLAGCPPTLKVADIEKDPGRYMNKEITVHGKVSNSYGALGMGMFQVNDGTGSLWVLSERFGVPGQGGTVTVTGTLMQTASFAGKSYSNVLRETKPRK